MLIVESDGLFIAFIHIPKTAGTTLRQILVTSLRIYFTNVEVNKIKSYPSPVATRRRTRNNRAVFIPYPTKPGEIIETSDKPKQTGGVSPKVICYGYWNVSNGIDLAHVPLRFFQNYYPPHPDSNNFPARWCSSQIVSPNLNRKRLPLRSINQTMTCKDISPTEFGHALHGGKMDKSKFTWITCVRNPYARIYSAYCWHNKERNLPSSPEGFRFFVVLKLTEIVKEYESLFKQNRPPSPEYIHFIPMWMMVSDKNGIPKVDHIIRQEEFDQQVSSLLKKLGLPVPKEYANAHCRKRTPPPPYDYIKHYDHDTIEIVEKLYRRDFELFGYRILGKSSLNQIGSG